MNNKLLLVIIGLIVAFGAFTLLAGNKTDTATSQDTANPTVTTAANPSVNVILTNSGFTPKEITVKTGTSVSWINKSGKSATVSSDDHPTHKLFPFLNLGEFSDSSSLQIVFDKPGTYTYHDHYNASSVGTVVVE